MNLIIFDAKVNVKEVFHYLKISLIAIFPTLSWVYPSLLWHTQLPLSYLLSTYCPTTYPTLLWHTLPHPAPEPIFMPIFILTYPSPIYISIYIPTLPYHKVQVHGVQGKALRWIESFQVGRSQTLVLDGESSDELPVSSGVPQRSVLGSTLFLLYINDLPDSLQSRVRLFADGTAVYLTVQEDAAKL